MANIIIPIPARDFDPSEVAISWHILTQRGHTVFFATPKGKPGKADPLMLTGEGLDLWGFVPVLRKIKLLGLALRANGAAREAYAQMEGDPHFKKPLPYAELSSEKFDALLLPGGHWARGMKTYLESKLLQHVVAQFFAEDKPVAAICHGVLLAARARSPLTGKSVLYGHQTTALTWKLESAAWNLMKYAGRFWDPDYYRTYLESPKESDAYWSVEAEVKRALATPADFLDATPANQDYLRKSSGLFRDSKVDARPAFIVRSKNYLSARWPGDVHTFATQFADMIEARVASAP